MTGSFLEEPPVSTRVQALYDEDVADGGYVQMRSRRRLAPPRPARATPAPAPAAARPGQPRHAPAAGPAAVQRR